MDSDCDEVEGEGVGKDLKCGALFGMDALNGGVTEEVCVPRFEAWVYDTDDASLNCMVAACLEEFRPLMTSF